MSVPVVRVRGVESPLALYRRYRPETFQQVIGQDHVTEPLRAALANNRVNHAYLFSGPRGCGKTTSARILARALNCEQAPVADPCGECDSCRDLARGGPGSIDVIEIDAASHGGVDDARDLREKAYFAPVKSRYKVYIIDEAHMVSSQGFNALLKLVEEPPEHLRFIFATTEPEKVIPTIRSRTHHYPFRLIPPRLLTDYVGQLCEREGVQVEPAALPLVVRAGGGSARDTLSVMDQLLGGAGPDGVTYALAAGLLGYTPDNLLDEVVDAFAAGDGRAVFGVVDKVIETGQDPRRFTEDLLRRLRDLVIVVNVPDAPASGLLDVPEDAAERLVAQAARFGAHELSRAADLVATGLTEMRGATAPRLLLELICARVLLPAADHGSEGLAARLDRLERRLDVTGVPTAAAAAAPAPAPAQDRPARQPSIGAPSDEPAQAPVPPAAPPRPSYAEAAPPVQPPAAEPVTPDPAAPEPAPVEPASAASGVEAQAGGEDSDRRQTSPGASGTTPAGNDPGGPDPDPERAPAGSTSSAPAQPAQPGMSLVDVRRLWPDVVEHVKGRRRIAWIHLTQNSQVTGLDGNVLTLGFTNTGARESFVNSRCDEIVRQAVIDVVGADWRIEAIIDPGAAPGAPVPSAAGGSPQPTPPTPPTPPSQPAPPEREPQQRPDGQGGPPTDARVQPSGPPDDAGSIARARQAIQSTREAGQQPPVDDSRARSADDYAHPDDLAADSEVLGGAELLEKELGAQVIEEIRHQ